MVIGQENQARLFGTKATMTVSDGIDHAAANCGTSPVRAGYELDETALTQWMTAHVNGFAGPIAVAQFKGGQSNPAYKISAASGDYVLRRKPPGVILPGAHAMDGEAKVLTALHGADFPVARIHGLCTDDSIIGSMFYVMDMVEGRIFWDATIPDASASERAALFDAMNAAIAQLHSVDYRAVGLSDYGRPCNYFSRQIARWSRQYRDDDVAGRDATMDRLIQWLEDNSPADDDETNIIHGDFRIDNIIFHPTEPRILAVLDWELSTLGHLGADLAYHAMMYRMPPHIVAGLASADIGALGIPDEAAYCARTGRSAMPHFDYYVAFNFFRLAAIFHGIKGRMIRGTATNAQAKERVAVLPELIAPACEQAERAGA